MIRLPVRLPERCLVAVSGGPDSMALGSFLKRRTEALTHVHHGTTFSTEGGELVREWCNKNNVEFIQTKIDTKEASNETEWRWARLRALIRVAKERNIEYVATGHNLNDVAETWFMSAACGEPKLIPVQTERESIKFIKPFLLAKKSELIEYCERHSIPYLEDPTNRDPTIPRSNFRHNVIPHIETSYPGIWTVLKNKYLK